MKVVLEGYEELMRKMDELDVAIDQALAAAGKAGAAVLQSGANDLAPSPQVVVEVLREEKGGIELAIGPSKKFWYFQFVESGTQAHEIEGATALTMYAGGSGEMEFFSRVQHPGMPAEPFLRPALDTKKADIIRAVGETLWGFIAAKLRLRTDRG